MIFKFKNEIVNCNEFSIRDLFSGNDGSPLDKCNLTLHFQSGREITRRLNGDAKDYIFSKIPENYVDLTKFEN